MQEVLPTPSGCVLKWKARIPTPTGLIEEQGLDIVDIEEGRIIRNEIYIDRTALMKALSGGRG